MGNEAYRWFGTVIMNNDISSLLQCLFLASLDISVVTTSHTMSYTN